MASRPYRHHGRGTLILDWSSRETGRIRVASGINNVKTLTNLRNMLDTLKEQGRLDIIRDIQRHVVRPLEVWQHFRSGELDKVPSLGMLRPLSHTREWLKTKDIAEATRTSYGDHLTVFIKFAGRETTTHLQDIPLHLERYKSHCQKNQTPRAFNYTRLILQSYLTDTKLPALWRAVNDITPFANKRKRVGVRLTVGEFYTLREQLRKPHADILASLCFTGMMPSEYWEGKWSTLPNGILIRGTKTDYRQRVVPKVFIPTQPARQPLAFKRALKQHGDYQPYDCRRTYLWWLSEAGLPRARRLTYAGHKGSSMLDLYEEHEAQSYLKADAELLYAYIIREGTRAITRDIFGEPVEEKTSLLK